MEERRKMNYQEVAARVESVRRLYSRIGEPLPADVIIELYRHLGSIPMESAEKRTRKILRT